MAGGTPPLSSQHMSTPPNCTHDPAYRPHRDKAAAQLRAETEEALRSSEQQLVDARQKMTRALVGRRQLEARRALDVEGFVADIALLRKALTATDRSVPVQHKPCHTQQQWRVQHAA